MSAPNWWSRFLSKIGLIGVLDLESTRANAFTAENERMLGILSSYIAIALKIPASMLRLAMRKPACQKDLDTAREIQRQLLPQGKREVPGLEFLRRLRPRARTRR